MPRKPKPFARIAVTLPPDILALANQLARRLDRSRSWVVAEGVRRFAAESGSQPVPPGVREQRIVPYAAGLGALRQHQLEVDLTLTPAERVRAAEESLRITRILYPRVGQQLLMFSSPEDYLRWKQRDAAGG